MRNPKHEIMLQNTAQGIMAHFLVNGEPDPQIIAAIETHIIPTPYTKASSMPEAIRAISKLNPGYVVSAV